MPNPSASQTDQRQFLRMLAASPALPSERAPRMSMRLMSTRRRTPDAELITA